MRNELIDLYNLACANPQDKDIVRAYQSAADRIGPAIAIHEVLDNDALRARLANWQDDINAVLKQRDDIHARAVRFEKALETIANGYIRQPICPHMDGTIEYGNHLMNRAMMIGLAIATLRGEE